MQTQHVGSWKRGLVFLMAAAGVCFYTTKRSQPPLPPVPQTTLNRIVDAAEPLCRLLVPNKDVLHFTAHALHGSHPNGSAYNLWAIECLDNAGKEIVHVLWDEDGKRCISISQVPGESARLSRQPEISRKTALASARGWVSRLHVADPTQAANAPSELHKWDNSWRVILRLPDGLATLRIDAHSGELSDFLIRPSSDAPPMQAANPSKDNAVPRG